VSRRWVAVAAASAMSAAAFVAPTLSATSARAVTYTHPWLDPSQNANQRADELLAAMTLAQKLQMVDGTGFAFGAGVDYAGHVAGIPSLSIPDLYLADGAVGSGNGSTGVTQFPSGTNDAATWDPATVQAVGAAQGSEQAAKGHNISLAPNLNILRIPEGGRAFEGYGEDPYLSSLIAASNVKGVQSAGVIATSKHYIGNDQETLRNSINSEISARALAEIYDPAFKATVDAGVGAVMCSYNKINGYYACESAQTLTDTLRQAWQFDGFVMSDWGGTHSTAAAANAGLDMQMPGGAGFGPDYYGAALATAVANGSVSQATLDSMVHRILWAMFSVGLFDRSYPTPASALNTNVSTAQDNVVALQASEKGTVLLKNTNQVLPLTKKTKSVAIIGDAAGADAMFGGGGSAAVNATNPVTPIAGITARAAKSGVTVTTSKGNSNYQALSALPATQFTPTSGTGNGWTATYYAGTTWSGTPLGSENVTSLNVTAKPALVGSAATWSVKYTAIRTPAATGTDEFALSAGAAATLKQGGQTVVSYTPGTGSTFTGLADVTAGVAVPFELDAVGTSGGGGFFGPSTIVALTWAPQEDQLWRQAQIAAEKASTAVIFVSNYSAEGSDLATLELPGDEDQLIASVAAVNKNTIVVLNTSAAVYMPWLKKVAGVFEAWYPGQQYGNAIAALLFGDVSPSGHLPETFPANATQGVAHGGSVLNPNLQFPGDGTNVSYSEGIDVGYRYFDVHKQTPLFPFGFGLSYTGFSYSKLSVSPGKTASDRETVTVTVKNTGKSIGVAVPQLYLSDPKASAEPPRQLKGFTRIRLKPGQSKVLTFKLTTQDLSFYKTSTKSWVASKGNYGVGIGSNERDVTVKASFTVK
jgi:beta-glucosidase